MEYNGIPEGVPLVADEVVEQLKEIPHVENVSRYLSRQDYNGVYHLNTGLSGGYVKGVDTAYFDTCNYIMKEGRGFTQQDFDQYHKVAILDEDSADALFQGEEAVGETIEIQQEPYVVVGIVTKAKSLNRSSTRLMTIIPTRRIPPALCMCRRRPGRSSISTTSRRMWCCAWRVRMI